MRREIIADHRISAGRQRRLPHAHANPREEQLDKTPRQPAQRRHHTPHRDANRDDRRPLPAIHQPPDGNAHDGIKQRKGKAVEQAELRIADLQRLADRPDHQREDLPVNKAERIGDDQHGHDIPCIGGGVWCARGRGGGGCGHWLPPGRWFYGAGLADGGGGGKVVLACRWGMAVGHH